MIVGLGTDITDLRRLERILARFDHRFLRRILSPEELASCASFAASHIGGRFAAKEACAKALGTGFRDGIGPAQIGVLTAASGRPALRLSGAALARARKIGAGRWHVSISHEREYAIAVVILED